MKDAFKPFWGLLIILAGVIAIAFFARSRTPERAEVIPWRTNFAAAQAEAAQSGKPVFAYFSASWCGPCQRLKSTTWADPNVEQALRAYVPVKIDVDTNRELVKRYLYTPQNLNGSIPAFRVIDGKGEIRKEAAGAVPPEEFLKWLKE